jgi:triosephosphate isomerase
MRIPIIAGNWKMNKTVREAIEFLEAVKGELDAVEGVEKVLCPPFTAISTVAQLVKGTSIKVGAQDVFWEEKGAYTGEISPVMLKEFCEYVIIGHSERRKYFGETDEHVNRKVKAALAHSLTPIICVGENLEENEAGLTEEVVTRQVRGALAGLSSAEAGKVVIAYEPVWAIGTGKPATPEGAQAVIGGVIRPLLAELFGVDVASKVRIQYGGSVDPSNIGGFLAQPDIDGALVGGASLKPKDFVEIVKISAQAKK